MMAKTAHPAAKRFTPELIAKATKLRQSGLTWDQIGEHLDVRSTGLLSRRVREAAGSTPRPPRKPARRSTATTAKAKGKPAIAGDES